MRSPAWTIFDLKAAVLLAPDHLDCVCCAHVKNFSYNRSNSGSFFLCGRHKPHLHMKPCFFQSSAPNRAPQSISTILSGAFLLKSLPARESVTGPGKIQNFYRENPATHSGARNSFSRRNVKINCKLIFPVSVLVTAVQNSASVIGGVGGVVLTGANDTGSCFKTRSRT
jgi:hypothetical protein